MNIISILLVINYIYLSIFVRSININVNKLDMINNRIRNASLRFIVFNKFYRKFKEGFINFIKIKNSNFIIDNNISYLKSNYYDLCYRYYSMTEEDRNNLEVIISLLY